MLNIHGSRKESTLCAPSSPATLFPFQQRNFERAEQRIRSIINVEKLASQIDKTTTSNASLRGAGIIFIDAEYNTILLRKFEPNCQNNPFYIVLKEPERSKDELTYATEMKVRDRESKLAAEAAAMLISCGASVLSFLVVVGSATAIPISGGASTGIVYLSSAATVATGAQCLNGVARTGAEVVAPEFLDELDGEEWYQETSHALDTISLAGAAVSVGATVKTVMMIRSSTGKSFRQVISGLNRQERKQLTEEIIRVKHPGISNKVLKQLIRGKQYPKRYNQIEVNQALSLRLKDTVAASLSFSGSFAAGTMRSLAVGLYERLD